MTRYDTYRDTDVMIRYVSRYLRSFLRISNLLFIIWFYLFITFCITVLHHINSLIAKFKYYVDRAAKVWFTRQAALPLIMYSFFFFVLILCSSKYMWRLLWPTYNV